MLRGQLYQLVEEFIRRGGEIRRVPDGVSTIDWSANTMTREIARVMSKRGHEKRWGRAA